jgi:hypothetical protein
MVDRAQRSLHVNQNQDYMTYSTRAIVPVQISTLDLALKSETKCGLTKTPICAELAQRLCGEGRRSIGSVLVLLGLKLAYAAANRSVPTRKNIGKPEPRQIRNFDPRY